MREGWSGDDYLILFEGVDIPEMTRRYRLADYLPGFQIVGIKGWDDFLLADTAGRVFSVPTVPLDPHLVAPANHAGTALVPDARIAGKIKWYLMPLVFGGSPTLADNIYWVSVEQHVELVMWWNATYSTAKNG